MFSEEVGRAGVGVIQGIGCGEREEEETNEASCRAARNWIREWDEVGRSKVVEKEMAVLHHCMQKGLRVAEGDFVHGYAQQGCIC